MVEYLRNEIKVLNKVAQRLKYRKRNQRLYSITTNRETNKNHFLVSAKLTVLYYVLFNLTNPEAVSNPHDSFIIRCDNKEIRRYVRKIERVCYLGYNQL